MPLQIYQEQQRRRSALRQLLRIFILTSVVLGIGFLWPPLSQVSFKAQPPERKHAYAMLRRYRAELMALPGVRNAGVVKGRSQYYIFICTDRPELVPRKLEDVEILARANCSVRQTNV